MTSTVACIGFTDPSALAAIAREGGEPYHHLSSTTRWLDPSGAMLLLDRAAEIARPGYLTDVRTPYRSLTALESGLAQVLITDASGTDLDAVTVIPEARYTTGWSASGRAGLVAMGLDVEFFPTAEDFFDSPRSAMPGFESEPPPEVRQFGLPWPPPLEIESFLTSGAENDATATVSGVVQSADVRRNARTGHEFLVARIATIFGEIDLCTPVPVEGAPAPGSIAVGTVEMLAAFPPHGLADTAGYEPPAEKVTPAFRETGGTETVETQVVIDPADVEMPDGLVLGDDGVVRTEEEHRAWKSGAAAPIETAAPPETPAAPGRSDADASPVGSTTPTGDDDSAPRPGETRREWRVRTGRA